MHPDAAEQVERIVLMGGAYGEGNVTPAAEFNIWVDPEAADRVFTSGLDVTMIGLDVTHQAIFGPEPTAQLKAAGRVGAMVAELLEFYGRFHKQSYGWDGSPIHDAVAMAHAFRPGIVETRARRREGRLRRGARPRPDELRPARPGRAGSRTRTSRSGSTRTRSSRCSSSASRRSGEARRHHAPERALARSSSSAGARSSELGVETIWVADHLGLEDDPAGRPWYEAWSCLTALAYETSQRADRPARQPDDASATRRCSPARRVTVATISGGRLELGLGTGASEWDHELAGVPFGPPRSARAAFVGWLERLRELLARVRPRPARSR